MVGLWAKSCDTQQPNLEKESRKSWVFTLVKRCKPLLERIKQKWIRISIRSNRSHHVDHPCRRIYETERFPQLLGRPDKINVRNPQERITGLFKKIQPAQTERLKCSTKTAFGSTRTTSHPSDLALLLRIKCDDSIGISPLTTPQNDRRRLYERHISLSPLTQAYPDDLLNCVIGDTPRIAWPTSNKSKSP